MNASKIRILVASLVAGVVTTAALAQVPPAPVLGPDKDTDGRPLPFGRVPHQPHDAPLGTGRYKAIMVTDESLPAHVLYYPAKPAQAGKLPVVAWGNGACINAGNRFRGFLTEIASHGYLVLANGVMASDNLEVGPQENPAIRKPGDPPPAPPSPEAAAANARRAPGTTTAAQLTESLDWAAKENDRKGSALYHRLDPSKVAVMGQSCGGVQALNVAGDPRITTMVIWSSGVGMIPNNPPDPAAVLASVHGPIAFIYGDAEHDIAYPAATQNAQAIAKVPVFGAWQEGMTHLGTYGQPDGGYFAKIGTAWLDWQLKGDAKAAKMFRGADCMLCTSATWHVAKQRID